MGSTIKYVQKGVRGYVENGLVWTLGRGRPPPVTLYEGHSKNTH